jgi:hypothetical protein
MAHKILLSIHPPPLDIGAANANEKRGQTTFSEKSFPKNVP